MARKRVRATPLARYRSMRDFTATPEPSGRPARRSAKRAKTKRARPKRLIYVIQKHDATRLHYDFRLEWQGVLKSWAVPKGPPLDTGEKRLAIETEDHPLDYARFEGDIPAGHYGAGHVDRWDSGYWASLDDDVEYSFAKGHLRFLLVGDRLAGLWHLVRTSRAARSPQWLLIKGDDADLPGLNQPSVSRSSRTRAARRSSTRAPRKASSSPAWLARSTADG